MFKVNGINRNTGERITVLRCVPKNEAERFCDMWNWIYVEADDSYWLEIQEV